MDKGAKEYAKSLHIGHASPDKIPWRRLGQYLYRILEDGSQTQYRLSIIESLLPPRSAGPVFHFHEMHDEGFYITKGKVRFHSPGRTSVDAKAGELVTVPIRLPHKFSNPFDEEAVFINTITPGFFVRYFEYLEELIGDGVVLTPDINMAALKRFATIPLGDDVVKMLEEEGNNDVRGRGGEQLKAVEADGSNQHLNGGSLTEKVIKMEVEGANGARNENTAL